MKKILAIIISVILLLAATTASACAIAKIVSNRKLIECEDDNC